MVKGQPQNANLSFNYIIVIAPTGKNISLLTRKSKSNALLAGSTVVLIDPFVFDVVILQQYATLIKCEMY